MSGRKKERSRILTPFAKPEVLVSPPSEAPEAEVAELGGAKIDYFVQPGVTNGISDAAFDLLRQAFNAQVGELFVTLVVFVNQLRACHHPFARELVAQREADAQAEKRIAALERRLEAAERRIDELVS